MSEKIEFKAIVTGVSGTLGFDGPVRITEIRLSDDDLPMVKSGKRYQVTMKLAEPELKPCPFCGGVHVFVETSPKGDIYWVICASCGARGPVKDWQGARDAWNCYDR